MSQKGSLMLRKKYGGKPAQKIAKNMSFLGTYMAQLTCFEWKLSHLSAAFCQNMLKHEISFHKFCPQSVLKHSVVQFHCNTKI